LISIHSAFVVLVAPQAFTGSVRAHVNCHTIHLSKTETVSGEEIVLFRFFSCKKNMRAHREIIELDISFRHAQITKVAINLVAGWSRLTSSPKHRTVLHVSLLSNVDTEGDSILRLDERFAIGSVPVFCVSIRNNFVHITE
jgi:hypothetical protein